MNEIDPRRVSEFLRIVFLRLWSESAGLPVKDIFAYIRHATALTEYEKADFPSTNTPRFERITRLATIPYVKAGWLVKNKGRWFLTAEGKQACKNFPNSDTFSQEARRSLDEWRQNRSIQSLVTEEAEENSWDQIRNYLQSLRPYEFQNLVGDLLSAMGYHIDWVAPLEKEREFVNFVVHSDPLGLSNPRIKVHILQRGQPVLNEGFKAFLYTLGPDEAGIFISTGGFTSSVLQEAREQKSDKITLVDLEHFFDLWVKYYDNLSDEGKQRFPLKPIYFLSSFE